MENLRKHLENIELINKEQIKYEIEKYLKNNSTYSETKVVCDNTNNFNDKYINIDIYYKKSLHYIVNNITIKRDKAKEIRKNRNKKLDKIYNI